MEKGIELKVVDADKADLAGIGDLLRLPGPGGRQPDLANDIIRFYGRLGVIEAAEGVELGIAAYRRRPPVVEKLEQHRKSRELLVAVDDDFLMPVAPNGAGDRPDLSRAFVLRVRRSEGLLFAPGAWHWVPYPRKAESHALVGFALGTAQNDMHFHDLEPAARWRE